MALRAIAGHSGPAPHSCTPFRRLVSPARALIPGRHQATTLGNRGGFATANPYISRVRIKAAGSATGGSTCRPPPGARRSQPGIRPPGSSASSSARLRRRRKMRPRSSNTSRTARPRPRRTRRRPGCPGFPPQLAPWTDSSRETSDVRCELRVEGRGLRAQACRALRVQTRRHQSERANLSLMTASRAPIGAGVDHKRPVESHSNATSLVTAPTWHGGKPNRSAGPPVAGRGIAGNVRAHR
jgi:hypothetical protein